jgi:hypothetical protein
MLLIYIVLLLFITFNQMLSKLKNFIKQSCISSSLSLSKYNVDETHSSVKLEELFSNYHDAIQEKRDEMI